MTFCAVLYLSPVPALTSSHRTQTRFLPVFSSLHRTFSASTSSASFHQPVFQREPDHESHPASLQENADITDGLNHQKIALKNSQKALEEETTARRATVSTFSALERQNSDFKAQNSSLKELKQ